MAMGDHSCCSQLHQFPQPTRPTCSIDINPEPQVPENRIKKGLLQYHSEPPVLQLPQPSRPIVHNYSSSTDQSCSFFEGTVAPPPPNAAATPKEEVEAVEELLVILIECLDELNTKSRELLLRKFFSEIEKEVSLERFIIERLKNSKARVISELLEKVLPEEQQNSDANAMNIIPSTVHVDSMPTRSIHESVEELSLKLERFKVKTLDLGGGVEEENKLQRFKVKTLNLGGVVKKEKT